MSAMARLARVRPCAPPSIIAVLLAWGLMAGCSSSRDIPPWFDQIQRLPIRSVTVQDHRLAYLDEGQGPAVVLLHGF
ncbi:MAG: hypothetical protein AB7V39_16640, partial [Nitrospiraceae bacterium]